MPAKSPNKRAKNGEENSKLRDTCRKLLSDFGDEGATMEMLKEAIRKDGDHILEDENSLSGVEALDAILQGDRDFEKVLDCLF